jgi:hypothetical protein
MFGLIAGLQRTGMCTGGTYDTQVCGAHLFGLLAGLHNTNMWCPPVWTAGGTTLHKYVVLHIP